MHYLHENDLFHSDCIKTVHNTLNTLGLSDIWLGRDTFYSQAAFKNKVKQEYLINLNYRLYKKEFCFEKYFNILPLPQSTYICKFRCLSHKWPIEKGHFLNIERN